MCSLCMSMSLMYGAASSGSQSFNSSAADIQPLTVERWNRPVREGWFFRDGMMTPKFYRTFWVKTNAGRSYLSQKFCQSMLDEIKSKDDFKQRLVNFYDGIPIEASMRGGLIQLLVALTVTRHHVNMFVYNGTYTHRRWRLNTSLLFEFQSTYISGVARVAADFYQQPHIKSLVKRKANSILEQEQELYINQNLSDAVMIIYKDDVRQYFRQFRSKKS